MRYIIMKTKIILTAILGLFLVPALWSQNKADDTPDFNTVKELKSITLVNSARKKASGASVLSNKKLIGLYFSAHWCGPCRAFTPKLVEFHSKCRQKKFPVEIIFISSDNDEKEMMKYMKEAKMKWPAVPYNSPLREKIKKEFGVNGIPTFIVLNNEGEIVSSNARFDVEYYGINACKKITSPDYKPMTYNEYKKKIARKNDRKSSSEKNKKRKK